MEIALALRAPADEVDTEFVGGLGRTQEFGLGNAEQLVELEHRRDGAFTDPYRSDRFRLDQADAPFGRGEEAAGGGSGHPAGSAAADNDDFPDRSCGLFPHRRLGRDSIAATEPVSA